MAEWEQIHYRAEPIRTNIDGTQTEVTPVVYDNPNLFGVGVQVPDGSFQADGFTFPRDMFGTWRGAQILQAYDGLECPPLQAVYGAGSRLPILHIENPGLPEVINTVGRERYDEIMGATVPESLVDQVLSLQTQQYAPDLRAISDEVQAGTLAWRKEFTEYGIEHPDEIEKKAQEKLFFVENSVELLHSAADSFGLIPGTPGYEALADCVGSRLHHEALGQTDDVLRVAFGLVEADLALTFMGLIERKDGVVLSSAGDGEDDVRLRDADSSALKRAAQWSVSRSTELVPGTVDFADAVETAMLEISAVEVGIQDQLTHRMEQIEYEYLLLEPRERPSA
ncbi:MAG TPA: hypothetical protein VK674_02065 [Candidatus Limnocylindria bacterium]|nr:hypothetical protein [Candidatus Limnocylindria bacterium]